MAASVYEGGGTVGVTALEFLGNPAAVIFGTVAASRFLVPLLRLLSVLLFAALSTRADRAVAGPEAELALVRSELRTVSAQVRLPARYSGEIPWLALCPGRRW